jgi:DNA-binding transcriptional regulator YiaG
MTELRRIRQEAGFSQAHAATLLAVPLNTFRMWDSGLRPTPPPHLEGARTLLAERAYGSELLGLQTLAREIGVHVRTLQAAVRTGRLEAQFSTQSVFGRPRRCATRAAAVNFLNEHYRRFQGQAACPAPLLQVPPDYDIRLKALRLRLSLSQARLAACLGAANKAVVYQWESRKRTPSPVFWKAVEQLEETAARSRHGDRNCGLPVDSSRPRYPCTCSSAAFANEVARPRSRADSH